VEKAAAAVEEEVEDEEEGEPAAAETVTEEADPLEPADEERWIADLRLFDSRALLSDITGREKKKISLLFGTKKYY